MHRLVLGKDGNPVFSAFLKSLYQYRRAFAASIGLGGLTPNEQEILIYLRRHGRSSAKELAQALGTSKSLISHSVERLQDSGYILAAPDPSDRRRMMLELSQRCAEMPQSLFANAEAFYEILSRDIGADELENFIAVLSRMTDNLQQATEQLREGVEQTG